MIPRNYEYFNMYGRYFAHCGKIFEIFSVFANKFTKGALYFFFRMIQ